MGSLFLTSILKSFGHFLEYDESNFRMIMNLKISSVVYQSRLKEVWYKKPVNARVNRMYTRVM